MQNRPADGVHDGPVDYAVDDKREQTGLLTRFVPNGLKHSAAYRWFLRLTRWMQLVSSVVSLGVFSRRMYNVYRLVNSIKTARGVNKAYGAVEGILAAAVLYTLLVTLLSCIKKRVSSPGARTLRWLWVLLDLLFVAAFIAVAVLTRPNGGSAGPRKCYGRKGGLDSDAALTGARAAKDDSCNLPWGTFILAIISTLLHAITAAFHEVRDHRRVTHMNANEKAIHDNQTHGHNTTHANDGHAPRVVV